MNKKNESIYTAIRIEGGLLSTSLLDSLRHYGLLGQGPADYGIEKGLKLADELGRYWRIAQARWEQFTDLRARSDIDRNKLAAEDWLSPLFTRVLGFEIEKSTNPASIGERVFPITHTACDGVVPLVLTGDDQALDKGDPRYGQEGRKRSPMGLAQEYLNAEDNCLWAMVSNGLTLRLLRDNPAMTRPAYVEVDLERIFNEELFVDFTVFWLLLHVTRFAPQGQLGHETPESCYLEQWRIQGQTDGERVLGQLRYGVADALRLLGTGFVSHADNKELRAAIQSGELSTDQFFQELLRLIYRFLFLLTTEDRDTLLDPQATPDTQSLYREGYSISNLRDRARLRRYWDGYEDAWHQLLITFEGFATGEPRLGQPALGGLFANDQCQMLEQAQLANRYLFNALFKLCYFESDRVLVRINYRDMDTEELGSVYESLLELIPQLSVEGQWRFGFIGDEEGEGGDSGHARKLTGSYYTPDSLVQELIKSALEPVVRQRIEENPASPRAALLAIRVCDPACGSGHFLLAAARRMAAELARIEAGADQPTEDNYRHALREVVRHCIYGVDMNPLAVELCRTALWLEAIEPGKPLGFLDAHIQLGNSLVGVLDPEQIQQGIPADAYKPLTGDSKSVAAALKQRNKIDKQQLQLLKAHHTELAVCAGDLEALPEESLEQVEEKRAAWRAVLEGAACQDENLRANLYTSAFFAPKTDDNAERVPTNVDLTALERGEPIPKAMREQILSLARAHRFFHWFLAFPDVFDSRKGKSSGFDVMLGNPPWDVSQLDESEYFSTRFPSIAALKGAKRKAAIDGLEERNPRIWEQYKNDKRAVEGCNQFFRIAGRNSLTARGKLNLYALFAELFLMATNGNGRSGFIVPTGISTDDGNKNYFQYLVSSSKLCGLVGFDNQRRIFPSVHPDTPFALITLGEGCTTANLIFYALEIGHLKDSSRWFQLKADEFSLINPNTLTCPVFRSERDAELTKKLYRTAPVLIREAGEDELEQNPWSVRFSQGLFNMTSASHLFQTYEELTDMGATEASAAWQQGDQRWVPLYEAKMVHHYDHRWATYETDGKTSRDCTLPEKQNPTYHNRPRYWVDEWQVTLRTAGAPKAVLDAAKKEDSTNLAIAMRTWAAGAASLVEDRATVSQLLQGETESKGNDLFSGDTSGILQEAEAIAREYPLREAEIRQLAAELEAGDDIWPLTRTLLEERRPKYLLGWRDITNATNERTVIAGVIPLAAVGDTFLLMFPEVIDKRKLAGLLADQCSLVHDFVARQKIGGTHLKYHMKKQITNLPPEHYSERDLDYIVPRVLELTYTSHDLKPFAEDLGYTGGPFSFEPKRRQLLKCELDAYYAKLYGLNREELRYILDPVDIMGEDYPSETFRVLKNREANEFGEYRTKRLVLEAWDRLESGELIAQPPTLRMITRPVTAVDLSTFPDSAWARPMQDLRAEMGAQLAAILKVMTEALPPRQVRLAALLAFEPRLLLPYLNEEEAATWRRLIGDEANPLVQGTAEFVARSDQAWGAAVRNLRTNGHLIEDTRAGTWAQGVGLDRFVTEGWPDGRARMVIDVLQRHATDTILAELPVDLRNWVDAAAA
ncbi:MAG: N-6 DNA methylase [Candidatus Thiodiazotropha endolucinida]|nr:N-6 DNA methylase [Candidatus Thiodiazotropha taylori]MCW4273230.1 N-6 DNA methylase [Candidatus Thiodiazotropha endolucinida]